jgi:type IV secretion system protein TrbL
MRKKAWIVGFVFFALATGAHAATNPGGSGYLDTISNNFQAATLGWMSIAQQYALHIFASLAVLDLTWWGIKNVLKKNDLAEFIGGATLKISSIFFFYSIVSFAPKWMPLITSSFMSMGQGIGGTNAASATPSGVMSEAFGVINALWLAYGTQPGGFDHISNNIITGFNVEITSVLGLIGFSLIALQLLMTQIEMYLVGGAGLVMLGFTGSGMTSSFGEKYIGYMISIGIKLLVIYAIIGLGYGLINSEITSINSLKNSGNVLPPLDVLTVGVSMLVYGVIGMQVPGLAGSLMNGSPNMSLGNVAGGAAAIVGGAVAAGAAGLAGYAGSVKSLEKLADMVGAGGGTGSPVGGIGGTDSLAALSSMTSASSPTMGGVGSGMTSAAAETSGTGSAANSTPGATESSSVKAPASGGTDALGAGSKIDSGLTNSEDESTGAGTGSKDDKSPWNVMGDHLGKLVNTKDDIARHEGSTGGGIQIRLNHMD